MAEKITQNIFYVGSSDPELRIFDIIMHTKYGTSYNAYIVKGAQKTAVFENVKLKFCEEYLENLAKVVPLNEIDYIVMSHTEPDHSGSLEELLNHAPDATVVASRSAQNFLSEITNTTYTQQIVKDRDTIDLGGITLEFIMAPFLHWPDTMFTYIKEEKTLVTGDMFGCHYASENILDDTLTPEFLDAQKYYFDVIISPFKNHSLNAIKKIEDLEYNIICPSHGPVLMNNAKDTVERFNEWSEDILHKNEKKHVVVAYVSAYGYTRELAEIAHNTLKDNDIDSSLLEITQYTTEELINEINKADGVLIGSPTFNRDALAPVWNLLTYFSAFKQKGLNAAAFGSYGWSGEAVKMITERMQSLGLNIVSSGFRTRFKPSKCSRKEMKEFTEDFIQNL